MTPSRSWAGATIGRLDAAARLILHDPERAKDAVQEAFVRASRDFATIGGIYGAGSIQRLAR
jgi:DNA-directed RNA polymerase specialized sigma24 family protein